MSEQTFGLAVMIMAFVLFCGFGFFLLFLPQIDRFVERMKKRRAA